MFQRQVMGWVQATDALMKGADGKLVVHGAEADWSCLIKRSDASVSKVSEQYTGAPQYLVDLVRHKLVFDSVDAQYRCLNKICQDLNIVVVHCAMPSDMTATFDKPGVTVYFILTTPEAYYMGVSGHVLELQLVLREISNIFDHAHDSYMEYRRALLSEQSLTVRSLRCMFAGAVRSCHGSHSLDWPLQPLQPPLHDRVQGQFGLQASDWPMEPAQGDAATAIDNQMMLQPPLVAVDSDSQAPVEVVNVTQTVEEIREVPPEEEELVGDVWVEEVCCMTPDMRDVLRQKCQENGDIKTHNVFEVRGTL